MTPNKTLTRVLPRAIFCPRVILRRHTTFLLLLDMYEEVLVLHNASCIDG